MTQLNEAPKTMEELGAALSDKHLKFAQEYLSNGLNARAAGRALKYKNPSEGPRLTSRPDIRAYVKAALDEQSYSVAHIKRRLEYFSEADMRDFVRIAPSERSYWIRADQHDEVREYAKRRGITPDAVDNMDLSGLMGGDNVAVTEHGVMMVCIRQVDAEMTVDWRAAEQAQALGYLKKLKIHKDGSIEYELHDPVRALELLGKAQKMFTDKVELSGNDGGPVQVQITRRIIGGES